MDIAARSLSVQTFHLDAEPVQPTRQLTGGVLDERDHLPNAWVQAGGAQILHLQRQRVFGLRYRLAHRVGVSGEVCESMRKRADFLTNIDHGLPDLGERFRDAESAHRLDRLVRRNCRVVAPHRVNHAQQRVQR